MQISYSSIELYLNCPKKYYFSEVEKIKAKKSKEQIFGTLIHSALKFLHQPTPFPPNLTQLLDYFKELWENAKDIDWQSEEEKNAYFEEGIRILKEYYKRNNPKNFLIVDLEKKFFAKIKESSHPEAKEHTLIGIIDRIDKISDNYFEIIDYKTSRKMPSQNMVDNNLQLGIYALGFEQNWPKFKESPLKLSLYFLKHSEKIKELREEINKYCDKKGIERIFSEEGYLQRERQIRANYDFSKIKEILEPVGFWNEILDPSLKKLKKIWSKLPEEVQKKIEKEAKEEKEFKSLKAVFKKIKKDKSH